MFRSRDTRGFSKVEVGISACILGLLAMVILPSYLAYRERTKASELANYFRIYAQAFTDYADENNGWPPNQTDSQVPKGDQTMFSSFRESPSTGGSWGWHAESASQLHISLIQPVATIRLLERVDKFLDDGNLGTGKMTGDSSRLSLLLER